MRLAQRSLSLFFVVLAFLLSTGTAHAACRAESALALGDILDLNASTIQRTGPRTVVFRFVVQSRHGFVCNGNGGTLPLPPGCPTDGIAFKPEFSSNVASAIPSSDCRVITVNTTNTGRTTVAFRLRFEEGRISPKRETFSFTFDLTSPFSQPINLPLNPQSVADPFE